MTIPLKPGIATSCPLSTDGVISEGLDSVVS